MPDLKTRARIAIKAAVGIFSEDSAKQAYGLMSGIFPGVQGPPPARGTREYLLAYSKMPWLRAVASRVATKTASTEWQLFVERKGGGKATRNRVIQRAKGVHRRQLLKAMQDNGEAEMITDHPLLDVLHDANPIQTGDAMRKVTQLHLDLVGEAFWLKERDGLGVITALWPIPPDWIASTPTPMNRNFRVGFRGWRGLVPDTEFIWFADPDPSNPYGRGSGTAQALADELETDEYAAKHVKAYFYNRARPDLIVYPKTGQMRDSEVSRVEEDWMARNQGFWKAFKPYFMNREVGIKELDQNFRQDQMVQLREYERDVVIQTFGVPPEMLGVLENANRATITAADLIMNRYVVEPRLEFQRAVMQERLVPEFDERLILDFVSPVQEDKDFKLDAGKAAPFAFTVDEWREIAGHGPAEDEDYGKMVAVPGTVSMKTVEQILNPPAPPPMIPGVPPQGQLPPKKPDPVVPEDDDVMDDAGKAVREIEADALAYVEWKRATRKLLRDG